MAKRSQQRKSIMTETSKPDMIAISLDLMTRLGKASLATIDQNTAAPYASLVLMANSAEGMPLLMISDLADHTQNLKVDHRAALMLDGTNSSEDGKGALSGARLTIQGEIEKDDREDSLNRFLARHHEAKLYASFADFHVYRMIPRRFHLVAGYGRIIWLDADEVMPRKG
jgi:putative heme iron utilization protein